VLTGTILACQDFIGGGSKGAFGFLYQSFRGDRQVFLKALPDAPEQLLG
jgi:hypothetical protein